MYIKFKDTLRKENIPAYLGILVALCALITFIAMGEWWAAVWAGLAGLAMVDVIYLGTMYLQESDAHEHTKLQLNQTNEQNKQLVARVDDLRKQRSDYAAKHEDAMGQLQALDNEYQKLAKQHNAQGGELSELKKKYDTMLRGMPSEAPVPTTPPKPKKNPTTGTSKKAKYTKKDVARIREEMKTGGVIKEKDEE